MPLVVEIGGAKMVKKTRFCYRPVRYVNMKLEDRSVKCAINKTTGRIKSTIWGAPKHKNGRFKRFTEKEAKNKIKKKIERRNKHRTKAGA